MTLRSISVSPPPDIRPKLKDGLAHTAGLYQVGFGDPKFGKRGTQAAVVEQGNAHRIIGRQGLLQQRGQFRLGFGFSTGAARKTNVLADALGGHGRDGVQAAVL